MPSEKVLISMPSEFLRRVDEYAESEHRTRSELIREALRLYLKNMCGNGYNKPVPQPEAQHAASF